MTGTDTYQGEPDEWVDWFETPVLRFSFFDEPCPEESYRDTERHGSIRLAGELLPEDGRYDPACHRFTLRVLGEEEPSDFDGDGDVTADRTEVDLVGEITRSFAFGSRFDLRFRDADTGDTVGEFEDLPPDPIPDGTDRGDRLHVRLTVEYLHEATKTRMDLSEADIEHRRERDRERIAEIRERSN